ncbi:MAG: hypothetical protein HY532_06210 [Chloroflexi bacterium]|nr:hypothetical protein [Chloroflexota bacterium]
MAGRKGINTWLGTFLAVMALTSGGISGVMASGGASPLAAPSCEKERGRPLDKPKPAGQYARRGLIGDVVGVTDQGNIIVGTQFGNVEIVPPDGFEVGGLGPGVRIAAHMDTDALPIGGGPAEALTDTPFTVVVTEGATGTAGTVTGTSFRIGTALSIKVVPGQGTRSHSRGVVVGLGGDSVAVADEDGSVDEAVIAGDGGVQTLSAETDTAPFLEHEEVEEGTDVVLLVECSGPGATAQVKSILKADRVTQRLERLEAKFEDDPEKAARFAELKQDQLERTEARLTKTEDNAPASVRGNVEKAKGKGQAQTQEECTAGEEPPVDCPEDKGKPEEKPGGGQGGGPPEDKGKGKPS